MTFKSFDVIEEPERFYEKDYLKKYDVCPALCMQVQKIPENRKMWKDGIAKWCCCGLECEWCTLTPEQARELALNRLAYIENRQKQFLEMSKE